MSRRHNKPDGQSRVCTQTTSAHCSKWNPQRAHRLCLSAVCPCSPCAALASTGSSRRDRDTLSHFTRLCAKVPLLQSNAPAKEQLTQIVFGSLAELRATEDRTAELCTGSLSTAGCALCSWKQKAFCEACGTDFAKTQSVQPCSHARSRADTKAR